MNITVLARPDILRECIELLYRYTNHEDTRSVKNELTMKYNLNSPDLLQTFAPIIEIGELVYGQLEAAPDRMAFFFESRGQAGWCCAKLLLDEYLRSAGTNANILRLSPVMQDERRRKYAESLFRLFMGDAESQECQSTHTDADLTNMIDGLELDVQEKWTLHLLYHNFDMYMQELQSILEQAVTLYEEQLPLLEPLLERFAERYHQVVQTEPLEYINNRFQIHLMDDKEIRIVPQIMGFNMVTLHPQQNENSIETLYIGILFEALQEAVSRVISDEKICKTLKMLSDASKFAILKSIYREPAYGSELADRLNLTTATISHHMNALIHQGFVMMEKRANRIYYRMNRTAVETYLEQLRSSLLQQE